MSSEGIERRIAGKLAFLRAERGWSLEALAERTGISRATLSRLERSELSPTASMLNKLCSVYGWTLSRLMAEAETRPISLTRSGDQPVWTDPASGYSRRMISTGTRAELVEVRIPPGGDVSFTTSPLPGLEHHLWMLEGSVALTVEGEDFALAAGDSLRYELYGPTRFRNLGESEARYIIALVQP